MISNFVGGVEGAGKACEKDGAGLKAVDEVLGGHGSGDFSDTGGAENEGNGAELGMVGGEEAFGLALDVSKVGKEVLDFFRYGA